MARAGGPVPCGTRRTVPRGAHPPGDTQRGHAQLRPSSSRESFESCDTPSTPERVMPPSSRGAGRRGTGRTSSRAGGVQPVPLRTQLRRGAVVIPGDPPSDTRCTVPRHARHPEEGATTHVGQCRTCSAANRPASDSHRMHHRRHARRADRRGHRHGSSYTTSTPVASRSRSRTERLRASRQVARVVRRLRSAEVVPESYGMPRTACARDDRGAEKRFVDAAPRCRSPA